MKIVISVDSPADLSKDLIEKYNISVMPFIVNMGEKVCLDGIDVNGAQLIDYVEKSGELPKTAAPSELAYKEHFSKLLENGYDKVVHYCISTDLSVACSNAIRASQEFNGNVQVVDSKALSSGIALLALFACDLVKEEKSFEEIVKTTSEVVPFVQTSFTLDNLKLLHKGGRCSGTAKILSMALAIKPSLQMKNGKLEPHRKYMLTKFPVVVKKYVINTLEEFNNFDKTRVFVTHTPTSREVVDMVKNLLKDKFDEVLECDAGATVSSHCGKDTIGILYINKPRS